MERLHRIIESADRLAVDVPRQRQAGAVPFAMDFLATVDLDRCEPSVPAKLRGRHLVGGDRVREILPLLRQPVGAREPERAPGMTVHRVPVVEVLENRKIRLVSGERREALRQLVAGPRVVDGGIP